MAQQEARPEASVEGSRCGVAVRVGDVSACGAVSCCLQSDLHVHFVNGYPGMMAHLGPTIALAIVSCLTGLQTRRFVCLLEMPHRAVAKMRCSGWA